MKNTIVLTASSASYRRWNCSRFPCSTTPATIRLAGRDGRVAERVLAPLQTVEF